MNNLISVVIPCYNASSFIVDCLSSIINQTYKNIEII
ncbi:glycosyltransferase, partial [Klebsiella pneumoniae]